MEHVKQPQLCNSCYATACAKADVSPPGHVLLEKCEHAGSDAVVIAMISRVGTQIASFDLYGPMPLEQANLRASMILSHLLGKGMALHEIRKQ